MDQFASPPVKKKQLPNDSFTDSSKLSNENSNTVNENMNNQSKLSEANNSQSLSTTAEHNNKYQYFLNVTLLSLSPIVSVSIKKHNY